MMAVPFVESIMPRVLRAVLAVVLSLSAVEPGRCAPADDGPVVARRPRAQHARPLMRRIPRRVLLVMTIDKRQNVWGTLTYFGVLPFRSPSSSVLKEVLGAPVVTQRRRLSTGGDEEFARPMRPPGFVPVISESFTCEGAFRRRGLVVSGRIDPRPLAAAMRGRGVERFTIHVDWDTAGTQEITPSRFVHHDVHALSDVQYAEWRWGPDDAGELAPIKIRYGFPLRDYGGWFAVLAGVLLLPVLATLWLRRRALNATSGDRAAVWFSYVKRVQLLLFAGAIAWAILVLSPPLKSIIAFLVPSTLHQVKTAGVLATMIVPALAMNMLAAGLSYAVYSRVRGAGWTRWELMRQVFWREAVVALPLLMGVLALSAFSDHMTRAAVLWLFGAFVGWIFAARRLAAAIQPSLHVVTTGPLRDRITTMAEAAGVKLQHIFVLDASKSLDANAAAIRGGGNSVLVTDYLIRLLNRREVDAIVAHELAHLKARHGGHPVLVYVVCSMLAIALGVWLEFTKRLDSDQMMYVVVPIVMLAPVIWNRFRSRRQERAADRDALQFTDHPEAHVTSLVRINKQGMIPLNWSRVDETWLTHPSTQRRVEQIGRQAGIPPERVEELIREAQTSRRADSDDGPAEFEERDHYPLPEELLRPGRVFTTRYKQGTLVRNVMIYFTVFAGLPAALLALAGRYEFAAAVPVWLRGLLAAGACWLLLQVLDEFLAVAGFTGLRRRLAANLADEGLDVARLGGRFVSFSPADGPRLYEGYTNWDVGFLLLFRDRLVYLGDQVRFALRREQVERIAPGPSSAAPWYPKRVYVTWRDEAGNAVTQNFGCVEGRSLRALRRATPEFFDSLVRWHSGDDNAADIPASLGELGSPQLGDVSSLRLRDCVNARVLLRTSIWLSLLAAGAAYVFGLSFACPGGAAWQAMIGSVLTLIATQAPILLYRESPDECAADVAEAASFGSASIGSEAGSLRHAADGDLQPEDRSGTNQRP
jgi:Zn-dependent protease with chaperone function